MWHSFFVTTPKGLLQGPMLPQDRGMEMDIVEHKKIQGSGQPGDPAIDVSNQADAARHWLTQNSPVCPSTPEVLHAGSGRVGTGLADGFHTYGLAWAPEFLKYYYDGIVVWAVNNSADTPVSHTNEYILLCGEVPLPGQANAYGSLPPGGFGPRGASNNPKMTVDYVRVYQDVVPPAVVTDLSVPSVAKNNVAVSWTAPGDDGTVSSGSPASGAGPGTLEVTPGLHLWSVGSISAPGTLFRPRTTKITWGPGGIAKKSL